MRGDGELGTNLVLFAFPVRLPNRWNNTVRRVLRTCGYVNYTQPIDRWFHVPRLLRARETKQTAHSRFSKEIELSPRLSRPSWFALSAADGSYTGNVFRLCPSKFRQTTKWRQNVVVRFVRMTRKRFEMRCRRPQSIFINVSEVQPSIVDNNLPLGLELIKTPLNSWGMVHDFEIPILRIKTSSAAISISICFYLFGIYDRNCPYHLKHDEVSLWTFSVQ